MPVIKVLDLSTAHAPSAEALEDLERSAAMTSEYGALIPVSIFFLEDWFKPVQDRARSLDCSYILFDRDAAEEDNLPTWDW